jgi:hypothetical protein
VSETLQLLLGMTTGCEDIRQCPLVLVMNAGYREVKALVGSLVLLLKSISFFNEKNRCCRQHRFKLSLSERYIPSNVFSQNVDKVSDHSNKLSY